jgi:sigma-E factor negative regulatory protein RseA
MDGELNDADAQRCLDRLARDEAARRDWALWHCVGDAMRSPEVAHWQQGDFQQRMQAALAAEPTLLAPRALAAARPPLRRFLVTGLATAAAAALLAVVAVPLLTEEAPPSQSASRTAPLAGASVTGPLQRSPQVEAYLAAHRELTGAPTMLQSAPYLRTTADAEAGSR